MKALYNDQKRVMIAVTARSDRQVLEAKFKLAPFGYAYGYVDKMHYWSFPEEVEPKCVSILKNIFQKVQHL